MNKLFSKNRYKFIPLLTTSDDDGHRLNRLRLTYCILVNASKGFASLDNCNTLVLLGMDWDFGVLVVQGMAF